MGKLERVCVFCGSSQRADRVYFDAAERLGAAIRDAGASLVYGGANVGLMGEIANTMLALGGEVRGVMPQHLVDREVAHRGLTELFVVGSMHERKARMFELSDAFVALPGGLGTLEELFEIATWAQLGLHQKPLGLLDVEGFYAPLRAFLDHAVGAGLLQPEHRALLFFDDDPKRLLETLRTAEPPRFDQLIGREST
jgi:uncharacterized protein (TIGR00730 family)